MWASYSGKDKIVKLLLDAGGDKDMKNQANKSATDYAREERHSDVTDIFEASQSKKNGQSKKVQY